MTEFVRNNDFDKINFENSRGVVFSFGRFNPFTRGHLGLANKIITTANTFEKKKGIKYDKMLFVSNPRPRPLPNNKTLNKIKRSCVFKPNNDNRNPFNVYEKVYWMKKLVPNEIEIINTGLKKIVNYTGTINWLKNQGYNDIIMVVGTDRYEQLLDKNFVKKHHEKKISFNLVENVRVEETLPELYKGYDKLTDNEKKMIKNIYKSSEISATKIRAAAASHVPGKNDIGKIIFRIGVGPNLSDKELERLIASLKKNMHLKPNKGYIDSVNKYVSKNTRSCFKNTPTTTKTKKTRTKGRTTFRRKNKVEKKKKNKVIITRSKNTTQTRSKKRYSKTREVSIKNKTRSKKTNTKLTKSKKTNTKQSRSKKNNTKLTKSKKTNTKQSRSKKSNNKILSNKFHLLKKKSKTRKVDILSPIKEIEEDN